MSASTGVLHLCRRAPPKLEVCCPAVGGGLVYDYQIVFVGGKPEFKSWSDSVPTFSYNKATPFFQASA